MLNARAIALQGFGYGARMTAVRGFGVALANADSYGSGDDDKKKRFIRRQNEALLMFVSAMASTGAFHG